jgi:hypothetical protein
MPRQLDDLADFEDFQNTVLPRLRTMIKKGGMSPEQIYKQFGDIVAARAVSMAVTEKDTSKALAVIKEILDRAHGKATEKVDITHKYQNLKEEQLDSLLQSELKRLVTAEKNTNGSGTENH